MRIATNIYTLKRVESVNFQMFRPSAPLSDYFWKERCCAAVAMVFKPPPVKSLLVKLISTLLKRHWCSIISDDRQSPLNVTQLLAVQLGCPARLALSLQTCCFSLPWMSPALLSSLHHSQWHTHTHTQQQNQLVKVTWAVSEITP